MASGSPPPTIIRPAEGWLQRYAREGKESSVNFNFAACPGSPTLNPLVRPTWTAGLTTTLAAFLSPMGRTRIITSAQMQADQWCEGAIQYPQSFKTGAPTETTTQTALLGVGGGGQFSCEGGIVIPEQGAFVFTARAPAGNNPFVAGSARGIDLTADFNWGAQYVIIFIGDSITYAQSQAGMSPSETMATGAQGFPMLVKDHLLSKGVSVRHVNLGLNGLTSPQMLLKSQDRTYYHCVTDVDKVALIVEMMGMNDATTGGPFANQAAFTACYDAALLPLLDYYPNACLLSVSHPGTNDVSGGRVANSATVRGYKQAWVTARNNPRITFRDGTLGYGGSGGGSSTPDGSITSSLLAPDFVHGGVTAHADMTANIGAGVALTQWGRRVIPGGW